MIISLFKKPCFAVNSPYEQSLSVFFLLDRKGGSPLIESSFEVTTAPNSGLVNLVFSHQTSFPITSILLLETFHFKTSKTRSTRFSQS